jgi:hypothetical protein
MWEKLRVQILYDSLPEILGRYIVYLNSHPLPGSDEVSR